MNTFRFTLTILGIMALTLIVSSGAQAQATRTWVSGVGDDVNPCSRTAPCKTYAGAISKTAKDGEISTLDPGGFGTVTITKSITINGGGGGQGYGSILAAGATQGVLVNITDPADVRKSVRLNWLDINGASTGTFGVRFLAGLALNIENTFIDGFTSNGVEVSLGSSASVIMRNVSIRNCGASGISTNQTGSGITGISYDNVSITKCAVGISAANGTRGSIRASTISLNTSNGIATAQVGSATEVNIDSSLISGCTTGINAGGSTHVRISRMLITQNSNSIAGAGLVDTGGNNTIHGNATNTAPNGLLTPQI
jgi:hypothetical protein